MRFEELFLTKEEEKLYQLKKLEEKFILSTKDMLLKLKSDMINSFKLAKNYRESYFNYSEDAKLCFSVEDAEKGLK